MLVECSHCGAPLDIRQGEALVRCGYCESTTKVRNAHTIAAQTPASWTPPPQWTPPPNARIQSAQALLLHTLQDVQNMQQQMRGAQGRTRVKKKGGFLGLGCALVVFGLIGAAIFGAMRKNAASFFSHVHLPGLNQNARPTLGVIAVNEARFERTVTGTTQGNESVAGAVGSYPAEPTIVLRLSGRYLVMLEAHSQEDVTLLMRTPTGLQRTDDDSGDGQDARLTMGLESGDYPVWVGHRHEGATFDLHVRTQSVRGMPNADGLVPEGPPLIADLTLDDTTPAQQWQTTAEDVIETRHCGSHVAPVPNLIINSASAREVRLFTRSDFDATLLVREPSGVYRCDDDSGDGNNAMLTLNLIPGATAVWVGLRTSGDPRDLTLALEPVTANTASSESTGRHRPRHRRVK